jgi:uncharacterized protein YdeI (YjbR/CyaY-like superfamily)
MKPLSSSGKVEFYANSRSAWRQWLQKNHQAQTSIWLVIYKKDSGVPSLTYEEAVEEALCFGWVDSKPNKRDEKSYLLFFAVRKPKSVWSKINKTRIKKLQAAGLMMPAGLAKIEAAKKDGSWTVLDAIEELMMPDDLGKAFRNNQTASDFFNAFPPGVKKGIYQWIISAKREETRSKRIAETVALAQKNIRANQWRK